MSDPTATGEAQIPATSTTVEPEIVPPDEGTSSSASPDLASPPAEVAPATGDKQPATPAADDQEEGRKPKPDRVKELLAERNYWRDKVLAVIPAKPAEAAKPVEPESAPTLEQFGYDTEKWATAFTKYTEDNSAKAVDRALGKVDERRQAETIQQQFADRETAFVANTPDYAEAVADPSLQQYVTPTISEAIVLSDNGPALSYHLATHRDELAAISRLRPTQQAVALGRLEAKLSSAPAPAQQATPPRKPVQQTRAPAPPTPVGGQSPTKDLASMPIGEYLASRTWR